MNKIIASGAAFMAGSLPVSAGATIAQSPECAPVYDEYQPSQVTSALQDAIDAYAKHQVAVHVEILKDAKAHDIRTNLDVENYQQSLAATCGYNASNYISIYVSQNPGLFNTYTQGTVDNDIPQSAMDAAETNFYIADLQDFSTPFQDDVANYLNQLNPYVEHPDVPVPAEPPTATTPEAQTDSNLPIAPIGSLVGLLMIAGAAGARVKRGLNVRSRFRKSFTPASQATDSIKETIADFEDALRELPLDDAKQAREAEKNIMDVVTDLQEDISVVNHEYRQENRRHFLWPSLKVVDAAADKLDGLAKKANDLHDEANVQLADLKGHIENGSTLIGNFNAAIDQLLAKKDALLDKGWNLDNLQNRISQIVAVRDEVNALTAKQFIDAPSDLVENNAQEFNDLDNTITMLPIRRNKVDVAVEGLPEQIVQAQQSSEGTVRLLTELRAEYDGSCVIDMAGFDDKLTQTLERMQSAATEATTTVGKLAVAPLEKGEELLAAFGKLQQIIADTRQFTVDRQQQLRRIQKEIPGRVDAIDQILVSTYQFANEKYAFDVEDETKSAIQRAIDAMHQFKTRDLTESKPKYLAIDETLDTQLQVASQLSGRAQAEKTEMDELRNDSERLFNEAQNEIESLNRYVMMHLGDLSMANQYGGSVLQYGSRMTRVQLRNYVADIQSDLASIEQARSKAEHIVREAEAERERQRQMALAAERQRQEAIEAERSRNMSHNNGGTFGGGHNNGGSFGGGHNNGGTF